MMPIMLVHEIDGDLCFDAGVRRLKDSKKSFEVREVEYRSTRSTFSRNK